MNTPEVPLSGSELKERLDALSELAEGGYLTDDEYSAARVNMLLDAGFDITPREAGSAAARETALMLYRAGAEPQTRTRRLFGWRTLLLIAAIIAGCAFAASRVLRSEERRTAISESLMRFWDDLRGNTAEGEPGSLHVPLPPSQSEFPGGSQNDISSSSRAAERRARAERRAADDGTMTHEPAEEP